MKIPIKANKRYFFGIRHVRYIEFVNEMLNYDHCNNTLGQPIRARSLLFKVYNEK